jgi:YVTN family beta-propeller protein
MFALMMIGVACLSVAAATAHAQTIDKPVRGVTDPGVITTRQGITPAGVQSVFDGRVYGMTFGATADELWVLTGRTRGNKPQLYRLDWKQNAVRDRWELEGTPGLQGLAFDPVRKSPLVSLTATPRAAGSRAGGAVRVLAHDGTSFAPIVQDLGLHLAGGPAISAAVSTAAPANGTAAAAGTAGTAGAAGAASGAASAGGAAGRRAVVPLIFDNALGIIDAQTGAIAGTVKTGGVAPFGAVISRDGRVAWVTNWGGRWPRDGDITLPTGMAPTADRVVVDARGIASTGTLTRIDLDAQKVTQTIDVGLHPTAIAWDEERARLYVANANADSITVVDTSTPAPPTARIAHTIALKPFGITLKGIAPTALAVAGNGATLFVALGGLNAVAVIDTASRQVRGMIPTAWYPNQLAISPDGTSLAIGTLLGVGSGSQEGAPARRAVHSYRGTINVLPIPDAAQLANYTTAVAENNHLDTARAQLAAAEQGGKPAQPPAALPVPARAGDPSLIEHVVYIIKENRTYDQLFGDLPRGNGDPSLVMFGQDVAPNHRKLATEFVLFDQFFATGGNSGDGHQWVTQANETSYALWPGYVGRSYPFDGTDPLAYASSGFLWDAALARGRTVRVYGEYAGRLPESQQGERTSLLERYRRGEDFSGQWSITAPLEPLNRILARNYPSYTTSVPDVVRAQIFLKDVEAWVKEGKMPNLVFLQLPSDHTRGATPDTSTAKAMVADNDLALGRIVESLTRTPFWKKMAILVVEDDAQNGVDHVDGHRTIALAISPYSRRQAVDSTFYAQQSMVKTIELMLGLPTLSLFDLIATDMRAAFTTTADETPYTAVEPAQSLYELNPRLSALRGPARKAAEDSLKMRFDVPDAAPTERLNRIVWGQIKGWTTPYPAVRSAVFAPLALDLDDDEREGGERDDDDRERDDRKRDDREP